MKRNIYFEFGVSTSIVIICLIAIFLSSCKTQTVVVERIQHDSVFIQNIKQDSIYIRDSIFMDRSKDTVLVERWHTDYRYKFVHDTTSIVRVDSIPYTVEVVREVRKPNGWDRFCHVFFIWSVIAIILVIAVKLLKTYIKR